ncbi:metalloregulator ArsR/SmtB family transcription factor [Solicola sp. PLA-1-18]|uniref:metalloregulator ArsR/SmtB family transcription factor n=1 Tax=Solicola sp. PLA-1-18 TaxID=3380532 RepID=UPI003B77EDFE
MDVFEAVADPVRRELLGLLAAGDLAAGELAGRFDVSRPAVSRHLRVLREAGLVTDQADGRRRVYRLERRALGEVTAWIDSLAPLADRWDARLDALDTEVRRTVRDRRREGAGSDHHEETA